MPDRKIRSPRRLFLLTLTLTIVGLCWVVWSLYSTTHRDVVHQNSWMLEVAKSRGEILRLEEAMTMAAHMAVETEDRRWEERYLSDTQLLEQEIKRATELVPSMRDAEAFIITNIANGVRVEIEQRVFDLLRQGKRTEARNLLNSDDYDIQRKIYASGIFLLDEGLNAATSQALETHHSATQIQIVVVGVITLALLIGWIVVLRLFSQWRDQMLAAQDEAAQANEAKANFLATMSHEIRTPLNGILGVAQLMSDTNLDDDQQLKMETIQTSGKTLLAIVNDVLDMSKIEAGAIELESTAFSLSNVLSTSITAIYSLASEKGLDFHLNEPGTCPNFLVGDPVRLRQVLWNLMSNAIKFTDQGSVTVTITAEKDRDERIEDPRDTILRIRIEDTGKGIDSDRIGSIFDPFIQEDTTITRNYGGTGLGLSIVQNMVTLMGGYIEVDSEKGKGTRFDVYLPFDIASLEQETDLTVRRQNIEISVGCGLNVLVAEDNATNAMIARAFLEKSGHRVRIAPDGKKAVDEVMSNPPDLIFMDIHMPEMNGVEATKLIRAEKKFADIPIVGLTAEAFTDRHSYFISEGMNGVLTKPFSEDQLHSAIVKYGVSAIVANEKRKITNEVKLETEKVIPDTHRIKGKAERESEPDNVTLPEKRLTGRDLVMAHQAEIDAIPIGDNEKIDYLVETLGAETFASVLEPTPDNLHSLLVSLSKGIEDKDTQVIREAAHAIRGVTAALSAHRVSFVATIVENHCEELDSVEEMLPILRQSAEDTIRWWASKIGSSSQAMRENKIVLH